MSREQANLTHGNRISTGFSVESSVQPGGNPEHNDLLDAFSAILA